MRDEFSQDLGGGYDDQDSQRYDVNPLADALVDGTLGDGFLDDWDIPGVSSTLESEMSEDDIPDGDEYDGSDELSGEDVDQTSEAFIWDSGSPDELAGDDDEDDDSDLAQLIGDELGWSLKGAVKGTVKGAAKVGSKVYSSKAVKVTSRGAKAVLRSPYTVKVAGGIAAAYPPAAPAAGAITVAHNAVKLQDDYNAQKRAAARKVILNTHSAAKQGDANARRMLDLMAKVQRARKRGVSLAAMTAYAKKKDITSRLARPALPPKSDTCPKALALPTYTSGFLVTAGANPRVVSGRFAKAS